MLQAKINVQAKEVNGVRVIFACLCRSGWLLIVDIILGTIKSRGHDQ